MRRTIIAALAAALVVAGAPAVAQEAGLTLAAGTGRIVFGEAVRLYGTLEPAASGETVEIVDAAGRVRASVVTGEQGRFEAWLTPRRSDAYTARWTAAVSEPVTVHVRASLSVRLGEVRLFGPAIVAGRLRPAHPGQRVRVVLRRNGSSVLERSVATGRYGSYRARLPVEAPGRYRVAVFFDDADHVAASARSEARRTVLPPLAPGARGVAVRSLESRLIELGYHLPTADRTYDHRTSDAVIAFHKVQGAPRSGSVSASTWRALASPRIPRPRFARPGFHIEIDQTRQVLLLVRDGRVRHIVHTSTGANGYTHDGSYRVFRKLAGTSAGGLYYPSYFDGLRAIHGWREVPTYPASHGCARIPMWIATWVYDRAVMGTRVFVYH